MTIAAYVGIAVAVAFLGLVALNTGTTFREGSYRRGVGWYADMSTPRETLMGRSSVPGPMTVAGWKLRAWAIGGIVLLVGALPAFLLEEMLLGILLVVLGLALLGMAWDGRRRNLRSLTLQSPD